jgi:hypothetical protein
MKFPVEKSLRFFSFSVLEVFTILFFFARCSVKILSGCCVHAGVAIRIALGNRSQLLLFAFDGQKCI